MNKRLKRVSRIVHAKLLRMSGLTPPWGASAPADEPDEPTRFEPVSARDRALRVLELDRDAKVGEIRAAYRHLCRRYHPDFFSHDEIKAQAANELLAEINRAYEVLSEP